jgi:hypothetical protein
MKSIAIVGGTFGSQPKRSKIVDLMYQYIEEVKEDYKIANLMLYNGGVVSDLPTIIQELISYRSVLWFPNISNDVEKVRGIKDIYPHKYLVTSKRNENKKYSMNFLVNHALGLHANLCVEFVPGLRIIGRVFDPLGNVWCDYTDNIKLLTLKLLSRLQHIELVVRQGTIRKGEALEIPSIPEFFSLVRDYGKVFTSMIDPEKEVKRFLGNTSFRCDKGFPSFRSNDLVFVSRRNVDKELIDEQGFVATQLSGKSLYHYGPHKPSVDTPIQTRLYKYYNKINYMIHSHTYIKDAPFTQHHYPCGALEEAREITRTLPDKNLELIFLNLIGHGSLAMSSSISGLMNIPYIPRPLPEIFV